MTGKSMDRWKKLILKNTEENAIITVTSKQTADGETDSFEFITNGSYYQRSNKFYIFYQENEEMQMSNCNVMLIAEDGKVTMRRSGDFELKLTYVEGQSEDIIYYMPFGEMNLTQKTESILCDLTDSGGTLELKYTLIIGDREQENFVSIRVKRK